MPDAACLDEFLALPGESEQRLVEFARRWGVIGACWHGGDHETHDTTINLAALAAIWPRPPVPPRGVRTRTTQKGVRQVTHWIRLSSAFAAVIRLQFEVRHGRPGGAGDWSTVWGWDTAGAWASKRSTDEQRWVLDELLRHWQKEAHLTARLSTSAALIEVEPRGLDAALVYFTVDAVRSGRTVMTCSLCGRPYLRDRPPARGELNYCPRHKRQAAWALAQQRRRQNLTDEQRAIERRKAAARMRELRMKSRGARQ